MQLISAIPCVEILSMHSCSGQGGITACQRGIPLQRPNGYPALTNVPW